MKVEMVMPQMGESIAEGTIVRWTKQVGDLVGKDENVLEISTDKVDSEIPSPAAGRLVELKAKEGETVPVGQVIAILETEVGAAAAPSTSQAAGTATRSASHSTSPAPAAAPPVPSTAAAAAQAVAPAVAPAPGRALTPTATAEVQPPVAPVFAPPAITSSFPRQIGERFYSPLVRAIARAEGIAPEELAGIPGSGRGGRVSKDDLLGYLRNRAPRATSGLPGFSGAPAAAPAGAPGAADTLVGASTGGALASAAGALGMSYVPAGGPARPREFEPYPRYTVSETRSTPDGAVEVVQMDVMRQKIAEHMVRSKATSPHVASVTEVDMTRIVRYRETHMGEFEGRYGFKLTYTPFIVTAAARALVDYPMVNSSLEGSQILVKRYVNLGVAVALESGLIVPVVKHAEEKTFLGIAKSIQDLASRARTKKLLPEDVQGGTFAVTNMGGFGNLFGIPIINQPNVGILGAGAIVKRPVVIGDAIGIRDIMYLSLSYDHRVVDGALGGRFIQRVRFYLEEVDLVGAI
jgi:2-oxoglutarate dehydrogenase E2 component (dihydrolipoamide succinyltransferase)